MSFMYAQDRVTGTIESLNWSENGGKQNECITIVKHMKFAVILI